MHILKEKIKEVFLAVLPITLIVVLLNFTLLNLESYLLLRFLVGAFMIVIGLAIFLFGVDLGVTPIGVHMGGSLAKNNKAWIVAFSSFFLGFFISVAEPDLHILGEQVYSATAGAVSKLLIVTVVSVGIGLMLSLGFLRIVYNKSIRIVFTVLYSIIFLLALFTSPEFLAISFDASGATTGAMTVPFILALSLGVSSLKKNGKSSEEDSFGLVGIASSGAIIAIMAMSILTKSNEIAKSEPVAILESTSVLRPFIQTLPKVLGEVLFALIPFLILFLIFNKLSFHLPKKQFHKILKGLLYAYIGLSLFLTGVNAGFMEVGTLVGFQIASLEQKWILVLVGLVLGLVVILAEPAVYALTNQIEDVTSGHIKKNTVMVSLAIGVAAAVALSMVRILVPNLQLWHYLLPGYMISIGLSYFVPKLFVGIAFDSGGVASGPMTATFILSFARGAADAVDGADVLIDGFGIIAMVAMMPIITLQILGLIYQVKSRKRED